MVNFFDPGVIPDDELYQQYASERIKRFKLGHDRYEKMRKLNPRQFNELCVENLKTGVPFDELVDRLPGKES